MVEALLSRFQLFACPNDKCHSTDERPGGDKWKATH
jgi:hypothetical protein